MILVRFDRAAIATGALLVSLFTLVEMRAGLWTAPVARAWSLDRTVFHVLLVGIAYAALFAAGDFVARRFGARSRSIYATIGALAALPVNLIALGDASIQAAASSGMLSVYLIVPLVIGAVTGFLYHRRAGYETEDDDPAALADAALESTSALENPNSECGQSGLLKTAMADYYGGPLQVKTSAMAALTAALIGGILHTLVSVGSLLSDPLPADAMPPTLRNNPGLGVIYGIVGISILYLIFVKMAHSFLQRRQRTSLKSYALAGIVVPLAFGLAFFVVGLSVFGFLIVGQFILPSVAAMIAYHMLAGMEPLSLPDDIEVSDRRALIGANHVRRRVRRVVDSGAS